MLTHNFDDFLVAKVAGGDEESLVGSVGDLNGFHVGKGEIANINPEEGACLSDLGFVLAGDNVTYTLVGRVESGEGVKIVNNRT